MNARLLVGALTACIFWTTAIAHDAGNIEPARRTPVASDPAVTVSGYVDEIVVENRVLGVEQRYRVLIGDDGMRYLVSGGADVLLTTGAGYVLSGRANGKMLYAETAHQTTSFDIRRTAVAAQPAVTIAGQLRLGHADNFDGTPSEFFYAIVGDSEQRPIVLGALLEGLTNGAPATVTGRVGDDGQIFADRVVILGPPDLKTNADAALQAATVTTGYLVMPIKFPTNTTAPFTYGADPFTPASLSAAVFGASPNKSAGEYYKEASYGKQLLSGTVADNGSGGFLLATVAKPATCDINAIATAADKAATARGYNLGAYAGRLYVFNNVAGCGWSGLAYVGHPRAYANNTAGLLVIVHELGHNFGLLHAASLKCGVNVIGGTCTSAEYGDPFDVMGNNRAMHFASAQKNMLGWLPAGTVALHKAGTASYALTPIETASGARYAVTIPAGPQRTYWIEYRQPIGFDSGLSSYPNNGAQIRVEAPFESICNGCDDDTEFLDMTPATSGTFTDGALVVGKSYVDSAKGITISTIAQSGGTLTVSVAAPTRPSFADVPATHPNYVDIETIYWHGITKGCGASPLVFCPSGTVSRAEMSRVHRTRETRRIIRRHADGYDVRRRHLRILGRRTDRAALRRRDHCRLRRLAAALLSRWQGYALRDGDLSSACAKWQRVRPRDRVGHALRRRSQDLLGGGVGRARLPVQRDAELR